MDIKTVEKFADLMAEKGLVSLEVTEGDHTISLVRGVVQPAAPAALATAEPAAPPLPKAEPAQPAAPACPLGEELSSPIVGIGYMAPAPDAAPFVKVGDTVKKGQVLCIIEAMKVMNEFTAPKDGQITDISFEDGQLVEFGQCLFRLL